MANEPTSQPVITSIEGAVLAVKLDNLKDNVAEMLKVMGKMQDTLQTLLKVEEQQRDFRGALDRCFGEIKVEREKFAAMQLEMPGIRSMRKWVVGGVVAGASMMAAALFNLLVIQPLYRGYNVQPPQTFIVPAQPIQPEHAPRP